MVNWMRNNVKDVKTEINNTLRVSFAFLVKSEEREGAKNKNSLLVIMFYEHWLLCVHGQIAHYKSLMNFREETIWRFQ
jgi:hypothetical protein